MMQQYVNAAAPSREDGVLRQAPLKNLPWRPNFSRPGEAPALEIELTSPTEVTAIYIAPAVNDNLKIYKYTVYYKNAGDQNWTPFVDGFLHPQVSKLNQISEL